MPFMEADTLSKLDMFLIGVLVGIVIATMLGTALLNASNGHKKYRE